MGLVGHDRAGSDGDEEVVPIPETVHPTGEVRKGLPRFFVLARACIACRVCVDQAPRLFRVTSKAVAVTRRQPRSRREQAAAEEALELCPTGAIGRNDSPA